MCEKIFKSLIQVKDHMQWMEKNKSLQSVCKSKTFSFDPLVVLLLKKQMIAGGGLVSADFETAGATNVTGTKIIELDTKHFPTGGTRKYFTLLFLEPCLIL